VRHLARPLEGDFSAQRNAVLAACTTEWVLFLDGDERLDAAAWAMLPAMLRGPAAAYALPRWTLMGTEASCRAGFGLWPDVQVRLFRVGAGTRFENRVHERVRGLEGPCALALTVHLEHYSHLWKDSETLAGKLRTFDAAAGRQSMHVLSAEYPVVDCALLGALEACPPSGTVLLLPDAVRP